MPLAENYWMSNGLTRHDYDRPRDLVEVKTLLDIGAGLRPMGWFTPDRHICVDAYRPYVEKLVDAGYEAYCMEAKEALRQFTAESIYLLDVIEHMEKEDGLEVLELAKQAATKQILLYTPKGFMEQTEDKWGYGGDHWQTHRSGWLPEEFKGWSIQPYHRGFYASCILS